MRRSGARSKSLPPSAKAEPQRFISRDAGRQAMGYDAAPSLGPVQRHRRGVVVTDPGAAAIAPAAAGQGELVPAPNISALAKRTGLSRASIRRRMATWKPEDISAMRVALLSKHI
jgi:hypothetical protein